MTILGMGWRQNKSWPAAAALAALAYLVTLSRTRSGETYMCMSRAVCIVMERELPLRFPSHGTSTRSHVPAEKLDFFQVPFLRNLSTVQYNMYILNTPSYSYIVIFHHFHFTFSNSLNLVNFSLHSAYVKISAIFLFESTLTISISFSFTHS